MPPQVTANRDFSRQKGRSPRVKNVRSRGASTNKSSEATEFLRLAPPPHLTRVIARKKKLRYFLQKQNNTRFLINIRSITIVLQTHVTDVFGCNVNAFVYDFNRITTLLSVPTLYYCYWANYNRNRVITNTAAFYCRFALNVAYRGV